MPTPGLLFLIAVGFWLLTLLWKVRGLRAGRHARCLANIARLEREMGIGKVPTKTEWLEELDMAPGTVWAVDEPTAIQVMPERPTASEWLAARGLLQSGEAARQRPPPPAGDPENDEGPQ